MGTRRHARVVRRTSLTDTQERALIAFSEDWSHFTRPSGVRITTIDRLAELGLIEKREYPSTTVARITAAGDALLKSMKEDVPCQ